MKKVIKIGKLIIIIKTDERKESTVDSIGRELLPNGKVKFNPTFDRRLHDNTMKEIKESILTDDFISKVKLIRANK